MGREISLFSDYHQRENSLTNHCGVLLRLIYRESPQKFEQLLVSLLGGESPLRVGPDFFQQEKSERTVPDLTIRQPAFSLFFETKNEDWFYHGQLQGHIDGLAKETGVKILFCLANFERDDPQTRFAKLIQEALQHSVLVHFLSFEELLHKVRALQLSNVLEETVDEFEHYLDRTGRLPRWRYLLDVVNCGKTMDEIQAGAYMCPNRAGPYTHDRARFLGTYQSQRVPSVHEIDALVVCEPAGASFEVRWKNTKQADSLLIDRARRMITLINPSHVDNLRVEGLQIFLLGAGADTSFVKDSPYGLQGSHLYFKDIAKTLNADSVADLAEKLKGRKWSEFRH